MDSILSESVLPLKYVAYSHCADCLARSAEPDSVSESESSSEFGCKVDLPSSYSFSKNSCTRYESESESCSLLLVE